MKKKKGFTLIELLVVVAIIGVLSTIGVSSYRRAVFKAQAAHIINTITLVEEVFIIRMLDDNRVTWWHEDDFPSTTSWAAYLENLINDEELIDEFLPLAPDLPGSEAGNFEYAYDNDGDTFVNPTNPSVCTTWSNPSPWSSWNSLAGPNIVIHPDEIPGSDRYWDLFNYLDEYIDNGDGPYCGRMRADARTDGGSTANRHRYMRYAFDYNQVYGDLVGE
ncbi:MAG: prepilin-type N-terminal cleavage/methylation domain-containing protein [Candidatus Pacebacteria bacterium]|nr:prepilin-type N-terminal cleavage/methylation domain-containing protein [Candidatus Paceibacterota bacterium]